MSCNKFKPKDTCNKSYAICVEYEGELSEHTELNPDDCNSVEEVLEDVIAIVDGVKDAMVFESLKGECIDYPDSELTLLQVLQYMQDFICQQNEIISQQQLDIDTMKDQIADLQNNVCP